MTYPASAEKMYAELSDTRLISLTCSGDQRAFEELVERYHVPIFNYLYRMMNDSDIAQDIAQDVFLRTYMMLSKIDTTRPLKPWLFQVAHNCCIDEIRRRGRQAVTFSQISSETEGGESLIDIIPDASPLPEVVAERHDLQQVLNEAILALPFKYRSVTTLRYASQLGFAEIGRILNMPEPTAKTYFARSKVMLRSILEQKYHYRSS